MSESEVDSNGGILVCAGEVGTISEQETTDTGSKRKKSLSEEDDDSKLKRCRERNRFHARNTRERKKNQIEMMLSRIDKLNEERAVLSAQVVDTTVADILMTLSSQEKSSSADKIGINDDDDDEKHSNSSKTRSNTQMKSLDQICAHVMKELVDDNDIQADLELLNKDKTACTSEELESIRRERNRLHAKKTRLRKKLMLQEMESNLLKLEDEVLNLRKKKELEHETLYGTGPEDQTSTNSNMIINHPPQLRGNYAGSMIPMTYPVTDSRSMPSVYDTDDYQNKQIEGMQQYVTIAVPYGMTMNSMAMNGLTMNGMPVYNCGPYDRSMSGDLPYHPMHMQTMQSMQSIQNPHLMAKGNLKYPRQHKSSNKSSDSIHSRSSSATQSQGQMSQGQNQVQGQTSGQQSSTYGHLDGQHHVGLPNARMPSHPMASTHMQMPTHPMSMQMSSHPAYMWSYPMGIKTMNGQYIAPDVSAMGGRSLQQTQPGYSVPAHFAMPTSVSSTASTGDYYPKSSRATEEDYGNCPEDPSVPVFDCSVSSGSGSERRTNGSKSSSHKHGRERRIYSHHTESVEKAHFPDQNNSNRHNDNKSFTARE